MSGVPPRDATDAPDDADEAIEGSGASAPASRPTSGPTSGPTSHALRWAGPLSLGALLLGLAVLSLPHHVQAGDAGEFTTVMLEGGVPHPSGYPWMRMLGLPARLLAALGMSPVRAAAWPCAAAAIAAWLLLWPLLARWSSRGAATVAVAVLATASPVVLHTFDAEVWGLHLLACTLVLRIADRPDVRPWQLGLALGLAISHHLSAALMLPVVVGAAWPRPLSWRALLRTAGQGIGAGLLGLWPYATLAIGDGGAWRWGEVGTATGLLRHVLRADYGVFQLSLHRSDPAVLDQWSRAIETVGTAAGGGLPGGALAGLGVLLAIAALAVPRPAVVRPGVWWGLALTIGGSTLAFPAAHNIDPTGPFGAWILERFDLLTILLWAPWWAVAADRLWHRVSARAARIVLLLGALMLLATQLARTVARGLPADDAGVERYARDLLHTPAPDGLAVVIGTDDHRIFPILAVQHVLHDDAPTVYIDASLLSQPWYREHLRARWPSMPRGIEKPVALVGALWRDPTLRDTPVYLANVFSRPASTLPVVPQGVLWRVLPPHRPPPPPSQWVADHLAALERYGPPPPTHTWPAHPWTGDLHATYNDGTRWLLATLHARGHERELRALRRSLGPWHPPSP